MGNFMKKTILFVIAISLLFYFVILSYNRSVVSKNNSDLNKSIQAIDSGAVSLNDIVPFEWDTLYSIEPYKSKEEIEAIVGFKSSYITDNIISEGVVYLIFVKGNKVVANLSGYPDNLGFSISFPIKKNFISFSENAVFNVRKYKNYISLTKTQ